MPDIGHYVSFLHCEDEFILSNFKNVYLLWSNHYTLKEGDCQEKIKSFAFPWQSAGDTKLFICQKLVSKESDLVAENLSNNVSNLKNEVTNTGEETDKTYYESNDVLGLKVAQNSVYATNDPTEEDEKQNLSNLRKALEGSGDGLRCHFKILLIHYYCSGSSAIIDYITL